MNIKNNSKHDSQEELNLADLKISVFIPCYNEEVTVGKVIEEFREQIPTATIYVFDNCSSDKTASIAREHGATVVKECRRGKGFVVESIFDSVDADFYIMVDGDDTYPAEYVKKLLEPAITGNADMVVGARLSDYTDKSFRPLHIFGNRIVRCLVNWVGKAKLTDIMSGYRVFNRRVVDRIPLVSAGFEVETEMTIQMLYYGLKIVEVKVPYRDRPEGSESKLRTFSDGCRVLWKIFSLFRAFKPLTFFGGIGLFLIILGFLAGFWPIHDYFTNPNHSVDHIPLAILAMGLVILSFAFIFVGISLHALNWRFRELHNVFTRKRYK